MEYKVRQENGAMVSYRLLDGNTTPEKVACCIFTAYEQLFRPFSMLLIVVLHVLYKVESFK